MRSSEEIFELMKLECPFHFANESCLKPYILEAMEIYAIEYHKNEIKQNILITSKNK